MRPKLKQDSVFLPGDQGVLLRNGETTVFLKGKSIYRWMSALAPRLTGERTLDEICAEMQPERRSMVERIVRTLFEKGLIKDHQPEDDVELSEAVLLQFRSALEFIDHHADRPRRRFHRFRQSSVIVAGGGESFVALCLALLHNGISRLLLWPQAGAAEQAHALRTRPESQAADVSIVEGASLDDLTLGDAALVAYCADWTRMRDVQVLNRRCLQEGRRFLPGTFLGGRSFVGPLVRAGQAGCWFCALLRLSANLEDPRGSALWRSMALGEDAPVDEPRSLITNRMLGNLLAFEIFKELTGALPPESYDGLLIQDLETLETHRSPVLPHPLCPHCGQTEPVDPLSRLQAAVRGELDREIGLDQQLERLVTLNDPISGLFQGFGDDQHVQLPLRRTTLRMGHPTDPAVGRVEIDACSIETTGQARLQAFLEGLRRYAGWLADRRCTVRGTFADLRLRGLDPIAPQELSVWCGSPDPTGGHEAEWLPAWAVFARKVRHVPAAAVFRRGPLNRAGRFAQSETGWVVGNRYEELRTEGVIRLLGREIALGTLRGRTYLRGLDLPAIAHANVEVAYLCETARRFGTLELVELGDHSPVHAALARVARTDGDESPAIGFGCGLETEDAARKALLALIARLQSDHRQEESLEDFQGLTLELGELRAANESHDRPAPASVRDLDEYLVAAGREVLFVEATPSDVRRAAGVIVGAVLITAPKIQREKGGEREWKPN